MLSLFERDDSRLYPAWSENLHRLWRRALRECDIGAKVKHMPEAVTVLRASNACYEVYVEGKCVLTTSDAASNQSVQRAISQVFDWLLQREEVSVPNIPLSDKGLDVLDQIRRKGGSVKKDSFHGSTVNSLIERGYLKEVKGGLVSLTVAAEGLLQERVNERNKSLEAAHGPATQGNGNGERRFLHVHEPQPTPEPQSAIISERVYTTDFGSDAIKVLATLSDEALAELYPPVVGMVEALRALNVEVEVSNELTIVLRRVN